MCQMPRFKKSTGADLLDLILLQLSAPLIVGSLTHILNLIIILGAIPRVWKAARVLSLHKSGDPSDRNNYHPNVEIVLPSNLKKNP